MHAPLVSIVARAVVALTATAFAACTYTELELDEHATAIASSSSGDDGGDGGDGDSCPEDDCGPNDPLLNDARFSAFNLAGVRSPSGLQITQMVGKSGEPAVLGTAGRRFVGKDPVTGQIVISADDIVGSVVHANIERNDGTRRHFRIHFEAQTEVEYWTTLLCATAPDSPTTVTRYWLTMSRPGSDERKPLCRGEELVDHGALLLKGERYDARKLTVVPESGDAEDSDWVVPLCEGHALEKMKLMGYEPNRPSTDPCFTRPRERQATIKMITFDACGRGHSFTKSGVMLHWRNQGAWIRDDWGGCEEDDSCGRIEARWNQFGPVCLDNPRLGTLAEIEAACERVLPSCDDVPADRDDIQWTSYLPTDYSPLPFPSNYVPMSSPTPSVTVPESP